MEGLKANRPLFRTLGVAAVLSLVLATQILPDLNELMELSLIPDPEVSYDHQIPHPVFPLTRWRLQACWEIFFYLIASWGLCWFWESACKKLFGTRKAKAISLSS